MRERIKQTRRKTHYEGLPADVIEQIKQGKKFIPLDEDIDESLIPDGWIKSEVIVAGKKTAVIMPVRAYIYLGDKNNPEELMGLYNEIKEYEKGIIENNSSEPGEAYFAEQVRQAYEVAKINELLDGNGNLSEEIIDTYLRGENVALIKQLASKATGTPVEELEESKLEDVIEHVTPIIELGDDEQEANISMKRKVKCYVGSHWEYKEEVSFVRKVKLTLRKGYASLEEKVLEKIHGKLTPEEKREKKNTIRTLINLLYVKKPEERLPMDMGDEYDTKGV